MSKVTMLIIAICSFAGGAFGSVVNEMLRPSSPKELGPVDYLRNIRQGGRSAAEKQTGTTVVATEFQLVNSQGVLTGLISHDDAGDPFFVFGTSHDDGAIIGSFDAAGGGSFVTVDPSGKSTVSFGSGTNGGLLSIGGSGSASVVQIGATESGGSIWVNKNDGLAVVSMFVSNDEGIFRVKKSGDWINLPAGTSAGTSENISAKSISITNNAGKKVATLGVVNDGGMLFLYNAAGDPAVAMGSTPAGHGVFGMLKADGSTIADISTEGLSVDTVRAKAVEVTNASGNVVVSLYTDLGAGLMTVSSSTGSGVAFLGTNGKDDGLLALASKEGDIRAAIGSDQFGDGAVDIWNRANLPVAGLEVDDFGRGILGVLDEDGNVAGQLGMDEDGNPGFVLTNNEGVVVTGLGVDGSGEGVLLLATRQGQPVVRASVGINGSGLLETFAADGVSLWNSQADPQAGAPPTSAGLLGDLDGDGDVDFSDFLTFAQNFGKSVELAIVETPNPARSNVMSSPSYMEQRMQHLRQKASQR